KTMLADALRERLLARRCAPVVLPLDLSWTDRVRRKQWSEDAARERDHGRDHDYFHALRQDPPMHWRQRHADAMVASVEASSTGTVTLAGCYSFATGETTDSVTLPITSQSIILTEGVYASALSKQHWDLALYIDGSREAACARAMVRDAIKV